MQSFLELEHSRINNLTYRDYNRSTAVQSASSRRNADAAKVERDCQIEDAVMAARDMVIAEGLTVTQDMMQLARDKASKFSAKGSQLIQEQAQKCFLVEAAVEAAVADARQKGIDVTQVQVQHARFSASSAGCLDYKIMQERAEKALRSRDLVYAVMISGYTKVGVDLTLSLLTLGDCFDVRVCRGSSVREVALQVKEERQLRSPPGCTVEVKLIGPAGTVLNEDKTFPDVVDYETDKAEEVSEESQFYPLAVLTGLVWKELGLDGPTRWKYLHEEDFMKIFGMSKASFEKLKPWAQKPLKQKHGLF